ncbi:MAG TPA: hypothetical protein VEH77_13555 [Roseiarcus sp.]|nr:hypothetical protein [Roseiarcus sp.]
MQTAQEIQKAQLNFGKLRNGDRASPERAASACGAGARLDVVVDGLRHGIVASATSYVDESNSSRRDGAAASILIGNSRRGSVGGIALRRLE